LMIYELFRNVSHVSWGFLDHKASPKLTVRWWPQSWKNGSKNGEIKGGLEHPTTWRF
jgi:hypothetical protein